MVPPPRIMTRRRLRSALSVHKRLQSVPQGLLPDDDVLQWLARPRLLEGLDKKGDGLPAIRIAVARLAQLADNITNLGKPDRLYRYSKVLAEHMVSMSLLLRRRGGHISRLNDCVEQAGAAILRLLPDHSHDPQTIALRGAASTFVGDQDEGIRALERVLLAHSTRLQIALRPHQQLDPQNSEIFADIAQLLQAVLEGDIARALGPDKRPTLVSQRRKVVGLRKALNAEVPTGPDVGEASRVKRRAANTIKRLRELLDRANLALPTACYLFPETMLALDDLVVILNRRSLRTLCSELLLAYRADREGSIRVLVALSTSLLRMDRLADAVMLFQMAEAAHMPLPSQVTDALIRTASRKGADELANLIVATLMRRDPERLELSSWHTIAGHISRRGNLALLEAIWQRIDELFPSQMRPELRQDHVLVAHASKPQNLIAFRKHLRAHWNLPGQSQSDFDPGKRTFTKHTFQTAIRGYGKGGDLPAAERTLDQMEDVGLGPDLLSYHQMIMAYVRRLDAPGAIRIWRRLHDSGLEADPVAFEMMVRLFANRGDLGSALALLDVLEERQIPPSQKIVGILMGILTRAGEYDRAVKLFEKFAASEASNSNVHLWNALLQIQVTRAVPLAMVMRTLRDMETAGVVFNSRTYALAMQSASEAGDIEAAEHLFAEADGERVPSADVAGQDEDFATDRLEDDGDDGDGDVIKALKKPRANAYHFTILIHAHLRMGNVGAGKDYFDEMIRRGMPIDKVTWSILARAHIQKDTESGFRLARDLVITQMGEAEELSIDPEDQGALQSDSPPHTERDARETRKRLLPEERPGQTAEILVSPLLVRAAQVGDFGQVEGIIGELEAAGIDPSTSTMNILLLCYRQIQDVDSMLAAWERIFARASSETGLASEMVYDDAEWRHNDASAVAVGTGRSRGRPKDLRSRKHKQVFRELGVPSVQRNALCISLSIVLDTLLQVERHEAIAGIWSRARAAGFAFDPSNWNDLTVALCRADRLAQALQILQDVLNEVRVDLSSPSFASDSFLDRRRREDKARLREAKSVKKQVEKNELILPPTSANLRRRQIDMSRAGSEQQPSDQVEDDGQEDASAASAPAAGTPDTPSQPGPSSRHLSAAEEQEEDEDVTDPGSNTVLEALARQGAYDETQAVWIASRTTLHEVQAALDRYSRGEKYSADAATTAAASAAAAAEGKPPAAPATATATSSATSTSTASAPGPDEEDAFSLLARHPRAAYLLEMQRRKDRALQEREDEEAEQMRRDGRL
ncbi:unnamed protein product [Parajaminaea phylloscopi]